ncbi:unnamed protein product [Trichobilharzia szidati]|nr:unnamed protein product [Trichobilharzia szidati]
MSVEIQSSRHLLSQPLWIKDPDYFDLQSLQRLDYHWHPGTSRKTEPEGIRARSYKPKVSAYRSTLNWDLGEKSKSVSSVNARQKTDVLENFSGSLTNLLNQQPRDWLIDDYDSRHKQWRRTDEIVRSKEPFTKMSLYREQFSPKEADRVQPVKPVHEPLKTSEKFSNKSVYTHEYTPKPIVLDNKKFSNKSVYTHEYTPKPIVLDNSNTKYRKICLPLEMIPQKVMPTPSAETKEDFATNRDPFKSTTYREDFQKHVSKNNGPVMCRKLAPKLKMSNVIKPPYDILQLNPITISSYRMNYTNSVKRQNSYDQLPAAGLPTSGGPIKSQRQTYSFSHDSHAKEKDNTVESLSHAPVHQLSRNLCLPNIIEQIENKWPYLEHRKGCFYTTKQLDGNF